MSGYGGHGPIEAPGGPRPLGVSPLMLLVLGAVTAIPPLATDMYVPGMPGMAAEFGSSAAVMQLTLTAFLIGIGVGQFFFGPLSDARGRRRPLLWGTAGYAVMSLVCAAAPSIPFLVGARFVQGVLGAAGMVIARAVIVDRVEPARVPIVFGWLGLILGTAPVVAPVGGGLIVGIRDWRAVFIVLGVLGALAVLAVGLLVPESLAPERRRRGGAGGTIRDMVAIARRPVVARAMVALIGITAALFAFIAGGTFVFQEIYGLTPTGYGVMFGVNAFVMVLAGLAFGRLSRSVSVERLLTAGILLSLAGCLALLVPWFVGRDGLVVAWIAFAIFMAGLGVTVPASMSVAQLDGVGSAGSVSALMGGSQFLVASAAAPLVGLLGTGVGALALVCTGAVGVSTLALAVIRPRRTRRATDRLAPAETSSPPPPRR